MKRNKGRKGIKRIPIYFLGFILLIVLGLIANNRIVAWKTNSLDTDRDILSSDEISAIGDVYAYLERNGDDIFQGLKENTDLIVFNDSFEFAAFDHNAGQGWTLVEKNADLNKYIYRRNADKPQAFAVSVNGGYMGSMSTKDTFNKSMANTVPFFFPPQLLMVDDAYYRALVIHEMVHGYEANQNPSRFTQIETLHDICDDYYDDQAFQEDIVKEAYYLEQAITAENDEDARAYAGEFLSVRDRRRNECKLSGDDIQSEVDFEWLEGLARYGEYKASVDSNSPAAKNLLDIDQKVKVKGDDRYYTLGMAQALVLDRLQRDWKKDAFTDGFSMEQRIRDICAQ